jgi:hypothetical protein
VVRIHSGVPHKPQETQEIRDETRSAEAEICIHLYPIQKKSETGGILDAEEKRHFRTFARKLCAANITARPQMDRTELAAGGFDSR